MGIYLKNYVKSMISIERCDPDFLAQAVNGKPLSVKGKVTLMVELGSGTFTHLFYVIKINSDLILGLDFLSKHKASLDCGSGLLHIQGQSIKLSVSQPDSTIKHTEANLLALETTELEPFTQTVLMVKVDTPNPTNLNGQLGIVLPKLPKQWNALGGHVLAKLQDGQVPMLILNPSDRKIRVFKQTTMGKLLSVDEQDVNTLDQCNTPIKSSELNVDLTKGELNGQQKTELLNLLGEYSDIFAEDSSQLGRTSIVKHHIDTGSHEPIKSIPYRVFPFKKEIISEHVRDMEKNNIIRPSCSAWSAPIVLIGKLSDDGTLKSSFKDTTNVDPKKVFKQFRFCIDYRCLNMVSKKDSHYIPRIDETLDALCQKGGKGSEIYSTLDMLSGYHQVELDEESKEKAAFVTPHLGVWEFNVLPFGLTNGPATYQRLMESLLRGICPRVCLIYIDDLICHSRNFAEHLIHLRQIFLELPS